MFEIIIPTTITFERIYQIIKICIIDQFSYFIKPSFKKIFRYFFWDKFLLLLLIKLTCFLLWFMIASFCFFPWSLIVNCLKSYIFLKPFLKKNEWTYCCIRRCYFLNIYQFLLDNANSFPASLLISYCSFSFLISSQLSWLYCIWNLKDGKSSIIN